MQHLKTIYVPNGYVVDLGEDWEDFGFEVFRDSPYE
jgi:hypothetical protein